tara:strand:+ start:2605 stop:4173 length:1569 start_codon:yes stop_codon:yes gene_type:complete
MSNIFRLFKILFIFRSYGLAEFLGVNTPYFIKIFIPVVNALGRKKYKNFSKEKRLRIALETLGPLFVKFGQLLSTRRDILYDELADELTLLQDRVKPFPGTISVSIIEKSLKRKISDVFCEFSMEPVASASVAQVHFAKLKRDNKPVAVKVLRPNVLIDIERDLKLLYLFAKVIKALVPGAERLKPTEVVSEFDNYLHDEVDLLYEAGNASKIKRNFTNSSILKIPEMMWEFCTSDVIVMERVEGIPINQISLLKEFKIDLVQLSHDGVEIFFTQVFRDGFFHADMHPGNILIGKQGAYFGKYIALDFGIVGSLTDYDKNYLARNFLAFFRRDYRRVAQLHVDSGWVPADTRVESLESAIRTVCEPYFDKPLKEISLGQVLLRLFQASKKFNVIIQPQLVLLQKTLLNIEGLGRQLNPELDLWVTAKPFLERWMSEQIGFSAFKNQILKESENWASELPKIPRLGFDLVDQLRKYNQLEKEKIFEITELRKNLKYWIKTSIIFYVLIILIFIILIIFLNYGA